MQLGVHCGSLDSRSPLSNEQRAMSNEQRAWAWPTRTAEDANALRRRSFYPHPLLCTLLQPTAQHSQRWLVVGSHVRSDLGPHSSSWTNKVDKHRAFVWLRIVRPSVQRRLGWRVNKAPVRRGELSTILDASHPGVGTPATVLIILTCYDAVMYVVGLDISQSRSQQSRQGSFAGSCVTQSREQRRQTK